MKRVMISIALIVALLSGGRSAGGDERLSLDALIEESLSENPEIAAAREHVQAARERVSVAGMLDDPQLKIELEDLPGDRFTLSPAETDLTRYTVSQTFPFPGKLRLRREAAHFESSAAGEEARSTELDVVSRVKGAYYEYAYLTEAVRITKELQGIVEQFAKTASERYATGLVPQQDVIKARVEFGMLSNELVTMEQEKTVARARINALLNRPARQALGEPDPLVRREITFDRDGFIAEASEKNPTVGAAGAMVRARESEVSLAKRNYFPDFMIGGAPIQRGSSVRTYDLMMAVNIPLWFSKYGHQVREARANQRAAGAALEDRKNAVLFGLEETIAAIEAAAHHIDLFETSILPQAELAFRSAQVNYRTGKVDFLSLLDSERDLRRARLEYARTLADYQMKVAGLERWIGRRLI